jgi:alpha-aminoadipic semialdehyde synthase
MFSHTAKGQEYNMPLLARFVAPSSASDQSKQRFPRLVDYELLTDENGKRTVGFGWFAGAAGVLESLASMAQHHLELGIASPFLVCSSLLYLHVPRAYSSPAHPSPVYPPYHRETPRIVAPYRVFDFTKWHTA